MNLSFKKRIAIRFMTASAIIIATVFFTVFFIVKQTVYKNIDKDLSFEANKHTNEIKITENEIHFFNKEEWEEKEHREVEVNPVFIQITDAKGKLMDKSPNLKEDQLTFKNADTYSGHFNSMLNHKKIRQIQIPIKSNNEVKGYIVAAMDLDATLMVLDKLKFTLFILYPIILIVLFIISSYLAGKSISPVVSVINTTNRINKQNLKERVELPQNEDVLFKLSQSINALLDRIEQTVNREKQFTSDASHELRTPLSVLKGTLEILIRKPREQKEYEEKIKLSLTEIDRMSYTIDQLLIIARGANSDEEIKTTESLLTSIIDDVLKQKQSTLKNKNISVNLKVNQDSNSIKVNKFYAHLIMQNVIDNAIKYSKKNSEIYIEITPNKNSVICKVTDKGIGIKNEDLGKIFNPFFRSDALLHKDIQGNGLGLSIVEKSAEAINAEVKIKSEPEKGTTVIITFNS